MQSLRADIFNDINDADDEILNTVRLIVKSNYNMDNTGRLETVKDDVLDLFSGRFENYQGCDTVYHDLKHTVQVINPFARIIDGWNRAGRKPRISFKFFELGLIAVLMHDTGYIKKIGDNEGTGGKYTFIHIGRSVAFAREYLSSRAFHGDEINAVCNMILCTGITDKIISFSSEEERICGYAVGTADFIGQMSARDYAEKLPYLYREFKEGYDYEGLDKLREKGAFIVDSAETLISSTNSFYSNVVKKRLKEMGSLDKYTKYHWPDRNDYYRNAIKENLVRLKAQKAAYHGH